MTLNIEQSTHRKSGWQEALLEGRSVVLVGASADESKRGFVLYSGMRERGVPGKLFGVNPNQPTILGDRTYASVLDLPETPDIAYIATAPKVVPQIVREVGQAGIPLAIIHTSGFAEIGAEGHALQVAAVREAAEHGVRIIGPNALGVYRAATNLSLLDYMRAPQGNIGLLSQSGSVVDIVSARAASHGVGFSTIIAFENQSDLGLDDYIDLLANDEETHVIAIYVESLREGRGPQTLAALRRAVLRKPVVVLKGGVTEAGMRAAQSHTAAIASPSATFLAMVRQAGAVLADSMEELLPIAETLLKCPPMQGARIAAIGSGGGLAILGSDALSRAGFEVPSFSEDTVAAIEAAHLIPYGASGNPIDMVGGYLTDYRLFADMAEIIRNHDERIDGILSFAFFGGEDQTDTLDHFGMPPESASKEIAAFVKRSGIPAVFCTPWASHNTPAIKALRENGVPCFDSFPVAAACLRALRDATLGRQRVAAMSELPVSQAAPERNVSSLPTGLVSEPAALSFLRDCGADTPEFEFVDQSQPMSDVKSASERVGYPQVIKLVAEGVAHKSELGGVVVGVASPEEAIEAVNRIHENFNSLSAGGRLSGTIIVEQIPGDIELRVGCFNDPVLGPVIDVGVGGTLTELYEDHRSMLAPIHESEAHELLAGLRMAPLFDGYRGQPAINLPQVAKLIALLSEVFAANDAIDELEVNPMILGPNGPRLADIKLVTKA